MAKYEKRIVAFIDILGFKDLVKQSEGDNSVLSKIDTLLNYFFAWGTGRQNEWDYRFIQYEPDVQKNKSLYVVPNVRCTCFSDSLVVSIPYDSSHLHQHFSVLVSNLAHIGSKFIQAGIPIRGGIAVGNLVHDTKGVIYGPAMIEAYQLEENVSIYPRIILSQKLIEELQFSTSSSVVDYPYHKFITRFDDGCVGFTQVKFFEYQQKEFSNDIKRVKCQLIDKLDEHLCNLAVFAKYRWLTTEFNKLPLSSGLNIKTDLTDGGTLPCNIYYSTVNPP